MSPTLIVEQSLWRQGHNVVVGIDEVGRGAWAGPVVVAAVAVTQKSSLPEGIQDSKKLTPRMRHRLFPLIHKHAYALSLASTDVPFINRYGIVAATQKAMRKALRQLCVRVDFVLIDAFYLPHLRRERQLPIVKGDEKSMSIAAASIVAKCYRDTFMKLVSERYPLYGFEKHKGYGTRIHQEAILRYGQLPIHRTQYLNTFLQRRGNF